jgi:hypothetical protein
MKTELKQLHLSRFSLCLDSDISVRKHSTISYRVGWLILCLTEKYRSKRSQETDNTPERSESTSSRSQVDSIPTNPEPAPANSFAATTSPVPSIDKRKPTPPSPTPKARPTVLSDSTKASGISTYQTRSLSFGRTVLSLSRRTSGSNAAASIACDVPIPPAIRTIPTSSGKSTQDTVAPAQGDLPRVTPASQSTDQQLTTSHSSKISPSIPSLQCDYTARSPTMMPPRLSSHSGYGQLNSSNGVFSPPQSPIGAFRSKRLPSFTSSRPTSGNFTAMKSFNKRYSGSSNKIGLVQESGSSLQKRSIAELGAGIYQGISNVSYINLLEWIRTERLTTLPHKGSRWDKVLIRALYFAEQLNNFDKAIQPYALDSSAAAAVGYGHAQLLLGVCIAPNQSFGLLTLHSLASKIRRLSTKHLQSSTSSRYRFPRFCTVRNYSLLRRTFASNSAYYTQICCRWWWKWPSNSIRRPMVRRIPSQTCSLLTPHRNDVWLSQPRYCGAIWGEHRCLSHKTGDGGRIDLGLANPEGWLRR